MEDLRGKVETMLAEIRDTIIQLVNENKLEFANSFMGQYIRLSPNNVERYSLEAFIRVHENDLQSAREILKEGLSIHPLSFDLLYNLAYVHEQQQEVLEAYHIYMKAKYVASTEREKTDIAERLKGLVEEFAGTQKATDDEILTIVKAGSIQLNLKDKTENLLKRRELLDVIRNHIGKNLTTVLEIGFEDGIISKNLNYYGYDVTAVDRNKEKILNVIAKEWHDNILQSEQKMAKFYYEKVNLEWIKKIPEFDVIIAVADNNLDIFNTDEEQRNTILELLLKKAKEQLFIKVSSKPTSTEFYREELIEIAESDGYELKLIFTGESEDGFELYSVSKQTDTEAFSIPKPLEAGGSKSTVLDVELIKCTDMYGAGYIDDFNHFVEVIKQYEENPNLKYEDSILKDYYDYFRPRNLEEGLFGPEGRVPKLRQGWTGYPWYWDKTKRVAFTNKRGETRPGGIHHFGPNTEEFGQNEFQRLIGLYGYFKKHGYYPEMFSDGYISGYLLTRGEDYRFVVVEGQHRMACLAVLGYEDIRCRFTQKPIYPRIVNLDDIKKWPQVENKVYSRNLAQRVFNRFFEDGVGRDRMGQ